MLRYLLRIFGSGRLPREGRRVVESERCRLVLERLVGTITMRDLRAPGRRSSWRRQWFLGSLVVSDRRVLAYRYGKCLLSVPFDDKRIADVDFSAENAGVLTIVHNASLYGPTWSGEVEVCLRTSEAMHICTTIAASTHRGKVKRGGRAPAR